MFRRIQQKLLIDRPLFYALAARIWQALSGPISIMLVIVSLTAAETGVYYGLGAIIGIQVFFELGLLNILISQVGYAVASGSGNDDSSLRLQGNSPTRPIAKNEKLGNLIHASERWFFGASILFGLSALVFGWITLHKANDSIAWKEVLIAHVIISSMAFALAPSQAILEGAGQRETVYRVRFFQAVTGSFAVWLALILGLKLWAVVVSAVVQVGWMSYLRFGLEATFFSQSRKLTTGPARFSWTREILPLQWRMAVGSVAYFLATQLFVVIILYYESDIAAGQLGLTLSIMSAIQMAALAWVQTNFSVVSIQNGLGNREAAGTHWRKIAAVSSILLFFALCSFIVVVSLLPLFEHGFEYRFITPTQIAIYSIGCLANHCFAFQSFYVLSRGGKPFLMATVVGYLTTAMAVWIGGAFHGITGLLLCYTLSMVLFCLPLHTWAYLRFRQQQIGSTS